MYKIIEETYAWRPGASFKPQTPDTIVIHHALCPNCTAQDVHRWHLDRGWKGIAYHFFIRKNGAIYRGRQENHVGGGLLGSENNNVIGICLEGCYTDYVVNGKVWTEKIVPQPQLDALFWLVSDLKSRRGIYAIKKHADYPSAKKEDKDCPGKYFPWDCFLDGLNPTLSKLRNIYKDADSISPWAREAVLYAYNKGLMLGDGIKFSPLEYPTREQIAVILYNLKGDKL